MAKVRKLVRFKSKKYGDSCNMCGCKDRRHIGLGLCDKCYRKKTESDKIIKGTDDICEKKDEPVAKDYRLHSIRRTREFDPIKSGDEVDMNEIPYLVKPRKYLEEDDLDELFPRRYLMSEEQQEEIENIDEGDWEDICSMDGKCCYGYGTARSARECCRFRYDGGAGCSIYKERPGDYRCPDIRQFFLEGTFHYLAHRDCNYWKLYEEITGCTFTNRQ